MNENVDFPISAQSLGHIRRQPHSGAQQIILQDRTENRERRGRVGRSSTIMIEYFSHWMVKWGPTYKTIKNAMVRDLVFVINLVPCLVSERNTLSFLKPCLTNLFISLISNVNWTAGRCPICQPCSCKSMRLETNFLGSLIYPILIWRVKLLFFHMLFIAPLISTIAQQNNFTAKEDATHLTLNDFNKVRALCLLKPTLNSQCHKGEINGLWKTTSYRGSA